jgi:hypothetical protein
MLKLRAETQVPGVHRERSSWMIQLISLLFRRGFLGSNSSTTPCLASCRRRQT